MNHEMKQLRNSIEAFLFRFDQLIEKHGFEKSYRALRNEFVDVCSKGDAIINQLIDGLVSNNTEYYVNYLNSNESDAVEIKRLIDEYLIPTIEDLESM